MKRAIISGVFLVGLVGLDLLLSSWHLSKVSPMMVFPSLMLSGISTLSTQSKITRISCGLVVAVSVAVLGLIIYVQHT